MLLADRLRNITTTKLCKNGFFFHLQYGILFYMGVYYFIVIFLNEIFNQIMVFMFILIKFVFMRAFHVIYDWSKLYIQVDGDTVTFSFEMRSGREHNTPDKAMWGFLVTVRAQVSLYSQNHVSLIP